MYSSQIKAISGQSSLLSNDNGLQKRGEVPSCLFLIFPTVLGSQACDYSWVLLHLWLISHLARASLISHTISLSYCSNFNMQSRFNLAGFDAELICMKIANIFTYPSLNAAIFKCHFVWYKLYQPTYFSTYNKICS